MLHKYKLVDCDVPPECRRALESYRGKLEVWWGWLNTDKDHAIWDVLAAMTWRDASFQYLRQMAIDNEGGALNNSLLMESLINGYVANQVLAIRQLIDDRRDVISLRRLLKDVKSHMHLFTRENYVCHDALPYDYDAVRQRILRERVASGQSGAFWAATTGPDADSVSEMVHKHFDELAGINSQTRNRGDILPESLLDTIEGWLDNSGAEQLAEWSHAYLAHAGNQQSRDELTDFQVTMDKITNTTKALARVAEALSGEILYLGGRTHGLMPVAQFTPFEGLDKPVMQSSTADAWKLWHQLINEQNRCLDNVRTELLKDQKKSAA